MIDCSEESVTIEESALHQSETGDKSEDSPLIREGVSDSLSKESQEMEYTEVSTLIPFEQ